MRIDDLFLRTLKGDNTLKDGSVESLMVRAGFVRRLKGRIGYGTYGLLLRKRLEEMICEELATAGFVHIEISGQKSLSDLSESLHEFHQSAANSYKDIPSKFFMRESVEYREENSVNLWKSGIQETLVFSTLGMEMGELETMLLRIFSRTGVEVKADHEGYFYPSAHGRDRYVTEEGDMKSEPHEKIGQTYGEELTLIPTPGVGTIGALNRLLQVEPGDIMKTMLLTDGMKNYAVVLPGDREVDLDRITRVLGLKEESLLPASAEKVRALTGAEVGFAGPVDLKVDTILVDTGIERGKTYVAGANRTDYHYRGVLYGRDFSGNFHSIHRRHEESSGWLLGELRRNPEKIRVQGVNGKFDYHEMNFAYLNVERLLMALLEQGMDEVGLRLPPELRVFQAVISIVDRRDVEALALGEAIYEELTNKGVRVLYDDRKDRMGSKFMDYDLLGIDKRVIVGKAGQFDVKDRYGVVTQAALNNIVEIIQS